MIQNKKWVGVALCALCVVFSANLSAKKVDRKKTTTTEEVKKSKTSTKYEKLFKDKTVKTVKGFITMHLIDGKLYMELPRHIVDRDLLIGSTIDQISDMGDGAIGQQTNPPTHVIFGATDSLVLLQSRNTRILKDAEKAQQVGIDKSNIRTTLNAFPIICMSPDSSYVFEATPMFLDNDKLLPLDPNGYNSFGGMISSTLNYENDRSFLTDVAARSSETLSVTAQLSYSQNRIFMGLGSVSLGTPFTAVAIRSIWLLPESTLKPRIADARIGTNFTSYLSFNTARQGAKIEYFANRWKLIPSDSAAYSRAEAVEPVKPIIFYLDDKFPANLAKAITEAVLSWNSAFEKSGFKNAIQVVPFSQAGDDFDPNDIRFSCIKYLVSIDGRVSSNVWTDPRTGEILSASIYVPFGALQKLYTDMLMWLGASDPDIRKCDLTVPSMIDALKASVANQTGACIGLQANLAASTATPVDSLRSASYTRKWGLSPSIMDMVPANFVAREGDKEKGVMLVQTTPGCYDEYAVGWLYRHFPDMNTQSEKAELNKMIAKHSGDKRYLFVRQQRFVPLDPRTLTNDLGDDPLKATAYRFENMKYVFDHLDEWISKSDLDYSMRETLIGTGFAWTLFSLDDVARNIGGVYLNEKYVGDTKPTYQSVPAQMQRASLKFMLNQLNDLKWMDSPSFTRDIFRVVSMSDFCGYMSAGAVFGLISRMDISISKSTETPLTKIDAYNEIYNSVVRQIRQGKKSEMMELLLLGSVLNNSAVAGSREGKSALVDPASKIPQSTISYLDRLIAKHDLLNQRTIAFGGTQSRQQTNASMEPMYGVDFLIPSNVDYQLYGLLRKIHSEYKQAYAKATSEQMRNYYGYYLMIIDKALKIE